MKRLPVAVQDTRGREDSEGEWLPNYYETEDGDDTLNWIAKQEWSDGGVGTTEALDLCENYEDKKVILGPWIHSGNSHYDVHGLELEKQDSTVSKPRWRKTASTAEENMLLMWRFE